MRPLRTPQLYRDYFDPFNAECRVYGRLAQEDRMHLIVPAFGYLLLTPEQETTLTQRIVDGGGQLEEEPHELGHSMWGRSGEDRGQPIRAIVNELIHHGPGFELGQIAQMWRDLQSLHTLGILVRDIHAANYLAGKLVDFGRAWTIFHLCLDEMDPRMLEDKRSWELTNWQRLVLDYAMMQGDDDWEWPEGFEMAIGDVVEYGVDPREYDWLEWEEDPDETERYVAEIYEGSDFEEEDNGEGGN